MWANAISQFQKWENLVNTHGTFVSVQFSWKLVRMIVMIISTSSLNIVYLISITRSRSQSIDKPVEHTHFNQNILEFG
jgi:hypothetical protein